MRAAPLAILALLAALVTGCGGSGETTTSRPDNSAASAKKVRLEWERSSACRRPPGASRWACSVGSYRCQAVVTGHGWSVDCAKPGRAIAFIVRPG